MRIALREALEAFIAIPTEERRRQVDEIMRIYVDAYTPLQAGTAQLELPLATE